MVRKTFIEAIARYELVAYREHCQLVTYDSAEDRFYYLVQGTDIHEPLLESELGGCYLVSDKDVERAFLDEECKRDLRQLRSYLS